MRIALLALDTRGGVQPYLALAHGMRAVGHQPQLLVPADAVPDAAAHGLAAVALTETTAPTGAQVAGVAEMSSLARLRVMRDQTYRGLGEAARRALEACSDAEVITAGIGGLPVAAGVAEKLGRPLVVAHLQPLGPPTGAFPGPLIHPPWPGPTGNRISHRLTAAGIGLMFRPGIGSVRRALALPRRPPRTAAPRFTLYGYSSRVLPKPPEWGPSRHVTGYWTLPARNWAPPDQLLRFLAAGPAPVCVGFGSMVGRDPTELGALVLDAVRRAGVRAIVLSGWGGLDVDITTAGQDVLVLEQAPHEWLLPRCVAVVHHGGAGTTAAGLRAGIPAVVVPFAADQPFWAARLADLGVAPEPLPRRRLTSAGLATALRTALDEPGMRQRAADVATAIRTEDGVHDAVTHFTALAG